MPGIGKAGEPGLGFSSVTAPAEPLPYVGRRKAGDRLRDADQGPCLQGPELLLPPDHCRASAELLLWNGEALSGRVAAEGREGDPFGIASCADKEAVDDGDERLRIHVRPSSHVRPPFLPAAQVLFPSFRILPRPSSGQGSAWRMIPVPCPGPPGRYSPCPAPSGAGPAG